MEENQNLTQRDEVVDIPNETDASEYISAINEIRKNSVPLEQYTQLKRENKELIDALKSGSQVNLVSDEKKKSASELSADWLNNLNKRTDAENWRVMNELRDAMIEEFGWDPAVGMPGSTPITQEALDTAQNVSDLTNQFLEVSDGDPALFKANLLKSIPDDKPGTNKNSNFKPTVTRKN